MRDSIDYYPQKRKNKIKPKHWILLLLILGVVIWYFDSKNNPQKANPVRIIISKPQVEVVEPIKPVKIKKKAPEILENLDELLLIHKP